VLLTPPLFNSNFGGVPVASDRPCWASARAEALSYSAVKLFSKNSNLCVADTQTSRTDRQTDRRLSVALPRSALASRGKNTTQCDRLLASSCRPSGRLYQRVPSRQVPICPFTHFCCSMYRLDTKSTRKKTNGKNANASFFETIRRAVVVLHSVIYLLH